MLSSEDKCEVSEDKYKDRRKMEYFREVINSTEGRKGMRKPPIEESIRMSRPKMHEDKYFYSSNSLHLETLGIILDIFCFYDWNSITRLTRKCGSISCSTLSIELRLA